ncbi:PadR family transcriptional regulator PadR [Thermosporothrix hazakensis]|uniref:PadR family transcriptional regulator PadR n=1 Tax=Thermosporothrix hazakensis TaxID=644383 RepID=A0A326U4R1_THEHA|nr:PadR family transcriptional regulator [Thermosporothrix hazakensis]PZW27066.1 PadR family transcriptional regulator PadR [Thermosporothrix hazakensis]
MEKRSTQLLKGTLDMCLLALIARRPCYGYEMVQQLAQQGLDLVSEGSIYPLLSRLQHLKYIEGYLVASPEGPKRKYYRLLPEGARQLRQWRAEWETFVQVVTGILQGEESHAEGGSHDTTTNFLSY